MFYRAKKFIIVFSLMIVVGCFVSSEVQASSATILISEIAWMGGVESANDEWLELENSSEQDIDVTGWKLVAADGSPDILLAGTIPAKSFFLLERSDDDSVPDFTADLIYTGSLGNDGETLELLDDDDNVIDRLESLDSWLAGNNDTKETMQLVAGTWLTATGTPKSKNLGTLISEEEPEQEEVQGNNSSAGSGGSSGGSSSAKKEEKIIINEIYPNPVGSDRHKEFIEIYNAGKDEVDLSGWSIEVNDKRYVFGMLDDLFEIKRNISIRPGAYLALFRDFSRLVLNNRAGTIKLFKPGKKRAEQTIEYQDAPEGYAFVNSAEIDLAEIATSTKKFFFNSPQVGKWVWSSLISPGANNQVKARNTAPKAVFSVPDQVPEKREIFFDSSDTIDEEGDDLEYIWNFDDGVELSLPEARHTFFEPGEHEVVLRVSDGQEESVFSQIINVVSADGSTGNAYEEGDEASDSYSYWYEDLESDAYPLFNYQTNREADLIDLKDLKNYPPGKIIKIRGVVAVAPGILASQSFVVVDNEAGLKIYNYKKDFPELRVGDLVEAEGELVILRSELNLKIQDGSAIQVLDSDREIEAQQLSSEDFLESNLGMLVEANGSFVSKKFPRVYLADDWGEFTVYIKPGTDIGNSDFPDQGELKIRGILGLVSDEIVLMPRSAEDIITVEQADQGEVLSASTDTNKPLEWSLEEPQKKVAWPKYFVVILAAVIILTSLYFVKKRSGTDSGIL